MGPRVRLAAHAGVSVVQVRYPWLGARELCRLVEAVWRETATMNISVIVNDRVDVALAVGADGVHLGQRSLPVAAVRPLVGPDMLIGASVHSLAEAREAASGGADYLTFGHVYPTRSHPGEPARGTAQLAQIVEAVEPVQVIAIGGVTPERVPEILRTGASGVAVMRAILESGDVERSTSDFVRALRNHDVPPTAVEENRNEHRAKS